ncbi:hypothetical protein YC2023_097229 [Brassica napus]
MINSNQVSRSHLPEVQKPKAPQTNWSEHAKAFEDPSSRTKHLSSGFLYALESQKPRKSRDMAARSIAFPSVNAHTLAHPQIAKAWRALSSLSLNKTYLRPGITPPVDDGGTNGSFSARERSTVKVTCSTDGSFYSNNQQSQSQMGVPGTGRNFHSFPPPVSGDGKIFAEKFPRMNDEAREPETSSAHLNGVEKPFRNSAFAAEQLGSGEACLDEIDDDILQNIDVDQIMMEHYQSTSTPPPSVSSLPSRTPPVDRSASRREEECCLPPELCSNCSHGIKLGLCPEASTHLEQMKNMLIAISNELLDDDTDLSPDRIQELRQERPWLLLKKQIQQLEDHTRDKERQKSQFLSSTATRASQYETPKSTNLRFDHPQTDSRAHFNEQGRYASDSWNMPKDSSFSVDRYGLSSAPVEREQYVPRIIEVTYTEGSNDQKWSSRDFPWTRKLESLGILKQKFPNIPVLALTATATASVKEDVVQALGLVNCIRVKHMISQVGVEQSPMANGYNRVASSGRLLETNTENLLRMVRYCENEVDCRRFLQLVHFGEKFDSTNCKRTCDNCSSSQSLIDKDVTLITRQLIELVKQTGERFSSSHILEVYRGSLNQMVKKHRHETLQFHGAGKHLTKLEVSRILHYLVTEDILVEDVRKSDMYGSVSSLLKVNKSKAASLFSGSQTIMMRFDFVLEIYLSSKRFPSSVKVLKPCKAAPTPAKAPLVSADAPPEDVNLSAIMYTALRKLRTLLVKEAPDGVMAYHIFGNATLQQMSKKIPRTKEELLEINGLGKAKVLKYGERLLETIESTVNEYYGTSKKEESMISPDSGKRRRDENISPNVTEEDDDFAESSSQSCKKTVRSKSSEVLHGECVAGDGVGMVMEKLDFDFEDEDGSEIRPEGRVLPW